MASIRIERQSRVRYTFEGNALVRHPDPGTERFTDPLVIIHDVPAFLNLTGSRMASPTRRALLDFARWRNPDVALCWTVANSTDEQLLRNLREAFVGRDHANDSSITYGIAEGQLVRFFHQRNEDALFCDGIFALADHAQNVIDKWERGDLAAAVHDMETALKAAKGEL